MSLNWNAEKVKDFDKLTDQERSNREILIWMTMSVGISKITDTNYEEFFARLSLMEKLFGGLRIEKGGKQVSFKLEEVERFMGLSTNASTLTRNKFNKRQLDRFYKERGV